MPVPSYRNAFLFRVDVYSKIATSTTQSFCKQRCNTRGFIYVNAYARTSMQRVQKVAAPVGVAAVTVCSLSSTPLSIRFRIDAW